MKHLKSFEQMNESLSSDKLKSVLDKLSKTDTKKLVEVLLPYKSFLKPYYDKYYVNGIVQPELIYADIRKFNFTAKTNESFDEDYDDDKSNPLIMRILYKIFVKFPKNVIDLISDIFKNIYESFKDGNWAMGLISSALVIIGGVLIWVLGVFAYQCGDYLFNGLEKGKALGGAEFEAAHYETHYHSYRVGKTTHTYTTHDYVPDRWHVEVRGIDDKERVEKWVTYDKKTGDDVWKGDLLVNDDNWEWEFTEEY